MFGEGEEGFCVQAKSRPECRWLTGTGVIPGLTLQCMFTSKKEMKLGSSTSSSKIVKRVGTFRCLPDHNINYVSEEEENVGGCGGGDGGGGVLQDAIWPS